MRYSIHMFGQTIDFDLTPEDLVRLKAEYMSDQIEIAHSDEGAPYPDTDGFAEKVYRAFVSRDTIEMSDEGVVWTMPVPEEVRLLGERRIKEIAVKVYEGGDER